LLKVDCCRNRRQIGNKVDCRRIRSTLLPVLATNRQQLEFVSLSRSTLSPTRSTLSPECRTSFRLCRQCVPGFRKPQYGFCPSACASVRAHSQLENRRLYNHGHPQEFLQEGEKSTSSLLFHPFPCLSILLLPFHPLPPALSTLLFILCCQADPLNPARMSAELSILPQPHPGQSRGRNRI